MSRGDPGHGLPPVLEEMIAQTVAREMKRSSDSRTILEFLVSNRGMRLPDGADDELGLLFEDFSSSPGPIGGPRCSICGGHIAKDIHVCGRCGKRLCQNCFACPCQCEEASRASAWGHLRDALWVTTGFVGTWSPWMGFFYLLSSDPMAGLYLGASILALCMATIHNRRLPWTGILNELAPGGS